MWGEQFGKALSGIVSVMWACLAVYLIWLVRRSVPAILERLTGFDAWGVKFSIGGGQQAMAASFEMAAKDPQWTASAPEDERARALEWAAQNRKLLEGSELLWVDDRPSNNRNEARMLRSFGALITFACMTSEAVEAVRRAEVQNRPFHVVLSDISRDVPTVDGRAGLAMLHAFAAEKIALPVIFYIGTAAPSLGVPAGAFAVTDRPDRLLTHVVAALGNVRSM